ncbi:MAG: hypothetical protein QW035_01715 [Candidatus Anstonellales archaeon]
MADSLFEKIQENLEFYLKTFDYISSIYKPFIVSALLILVATFVTVFGSVLLGYLIGFLIFLALVAISAAFPPLALLGVAALPIAIVLAFLFIMAVVMVLAGIADSVYLELLYGALARKEKWDYPDWLNRVLGLFSSGINSALPYAGIRIVFGLITLAIVGIVLLPVLIAVVLLGIGAGPLGIVGAFFGLYGMLFLGIIVLIPVRIVVNFLDKAAIVHRKLSGDGIIASVKWALDYALLKSGHRTFSLAGIIIELLAVLVSIIPIISIIAPYVAYLANCGSIMRAELPAEAEAKEKPRGRRK